MSRKTILTRSAYASCGTQVNSMAEACAAVPFHIESEPAARFSTGEAIKGTKNLYRSDNGYCLGQHSEKFTFLQPCETLETLENAREFIGGQWSSVFVNKGGRKLLAFIELEEKIVIAQRDDEISFSVGFLDAFDGSGSQQMMLLGNVGKCTNGMIIADVLVKFSAKHCLNLPERYAAMESQLTTNLALQIGKTRDIVTTLATSPFSLSEMENFAEKLFPSKTEKVSTRTANMREAITAGFTRGTGNEGKTRWDAINAVTEFLDWESTFRATEFSREENRIDSLLLGSASKTRSRAMDLLIA